MVDNTLPPFSHIVCWSVWILLKPPCLLSVLSPLSLQFLVLSPSTVTDIYLQRNMGAAHKIAHVAYKGPSVVKEIIYGIALGLTAGGLWKMNQWNNQRRTREFYDLLERGEISVVVEEE
ncbi:putative cytochrome c oxidase subunit 5C-4 isoform X1 [Hevea brasiliensis]|nr:putative cytochrome c oxidase subunit 5C-4 isoform X1 [Hevea brasiliensis]XP_057996932.1 putative cytochrome c oxidase subunit 5C-4 isoform X1 [Hevea brasiliensis]